MFIDGQEVFRTLARPGELIGTESVAAWCDEEVGFQSYGAEVIDPCQVLELPADRFRKVFARSRTLLAAVLSAQCVLQHSRLLAKIVHASVPFRYVRRDLAMHALMVGGKIYRAKRGDRVVEEGEIPTKFVIIIEGRLQRRKKHGKNESDHGHYDRGALIGLQHILARSPAKHSAVAEEESLLLTVTEDHLRRGLQTTPRLAAAVAASLGRVKLFDGGHDAISTAQITLILDGTGPKQRLPIARWVERLGRSIHREFDDDVTVVQLLPNGGKGTPPQQDRPREVQVVQVRLNNFKRKFINKISKNLGNVVLVDPSELGLKLGSPSKLLSTLFDHCHDLNVAVRAAVLVDDPADWRTLQLNLPLEQSRWVLGTALLNAVDFEDALGESPDRPDRWPRGAAGLAGGSWPSLHGTADWARRWLLVESSMHHGHRKFAVSLEENLVEHDQIVCDRPPVVADDHDRV